MTTMSPFHHAAGDKEVNELHKINEHTQIELVREIEIERVECFET